MQQKEVEIRSDLTQLSRTQVKAPSMLDWGMELVAVTEPIEVRRLEREVNWSGAVSAWDPWVGAGMIGRVIQEEQRTLQFLNTDWNAQLGWPETRDAL
ncbi:hypothetical protein CYMTET_13404 [Cymbomonas tetramitiformis]|uniref:Uncharacterized protein n=1 Tax=Cymbomonas tetramitiformis TaxID=36881 RepID=A0AAE0LBF5_9CHLO|nr:hypothetical protein CYMTET_13404 [Cymbomonas tetramitiformis]